MIPTVIPSFLLKNSMAILLTFVIVNLDIFLLTLFYKSNSLICLGAFGLSYFLTSLYVKNKIVCLLLAGVSSYYLFNCGFNKNIIEGNENLEKMQGCDSDLNDTIELSKKTYEQLKEYRQKCENVLLEINSKLETTDKEEKEARQKDKDKFMERLRNVKEAMKNCSLFNTKENCNKHSSCNWGKVKDAGENSPEICLEK